MNTNTITNTIQSGTAQWRYIPQHPLHSAAWLATETGQFQIRELTPGKEPVVAFRRTVRGRWYFFCEVPTATNNVEYQFVTDAD